MTTAREMVPVQSTWINKNTKREATVVEVRQGLHDYLIYYREGNKHSRRADYKKFLEQWDIKTALVPQHSR